MFAFVLGPLFGRHFISLSFFFLRFFSRWFKEENEQLLPLQLSERITIVSAGLLKITKVRRLHWEKY